MQDENFQIPTQQPGIIFDAHPQYYPLTEEEWKDLLKNLNLEKLSDVQVQKN